MSEMKCVVTHPDQLGEKNDDPKSILRFLKNPICHESVVRGVVCPVFFNEYEEEYFDGLKENNVFTILSGPGSGKTTFPYFFCRNRKLENIYMTASELYYCSFGSSYEKMKIGDIQQRIEKSLMKKVLKSKQEDLTSITTLSEALKHVFGENSFCVHVDELQRFMIEDDFVRKRNQEEVVSPREYFIIILCDVLKAFSNTEEHRSFVFLTGTDVSFDQKIRLSSDLKTENITLTSCTPKTVSFILKYFLRLKDEDLERCCKRLCGCYRSVVYFVDSFYKKPDAKCDDHLESAYARWEKDVDSIFSKIVNEELVLDKLLIARSMCLDIGESVLSISRTELREFFGHEEFEGGANSGAMEIKSHGSDYQVSLSPYPFLLSYWYKFSSFDFSWYVLEQLAYSQHLDPKKRKGNVFQHLCAVDLMKNDSALRKVIENKIIKNNPVIKEIRWNGESKIKFDYFSSNDDYKANGGGMSHLVVREVVESSSKKDGDIQIRCAIDLDVGEDTYEGVSLIIECKYAEDVDYVRKGFTKFFEGCKKREEKKEFYIFVNPYAVFYKNNGIGKTNMENLLSETKKFNGHFLKTNIVVEEKSFENQEFLFDFKSVIEKLGDPDTVKKVLRVMHKKRNEMDAKKKNSEMEDEESETKMFKVFSIIRKSKSLPIKLSGGIVDVKKEIYDKLCEGDFDEKETKWKHYRIYDENLNPLGNDLEILMNMEENSVFYFLTNDELEEEDEARKLKEEDEDRKLKEEDEARKLKEELKEDQCVRLFFVDKRGSCGVEVFFDVCLDNYKGLKFKEAIEKFKEEEDFRKKKKDDKKTELCIFEYNVGILNKWVGKRYRMNRPCSSLIGQIMFFVTEDEKKKINEGKIKFVAGSGMSSLDKWFYDEEGNSGASAIVSTKQGSVKIDKQNVILESLNGDNFNVSIGLLLSKSALFNKAMWFAGSELESVIKNGSMNVLMSTNVLDQYLSLVFSENMTTIDIGIVLEVMIQCVMYEEREDLIFQCLSRFSFILDEQDEDEVMLKLLEVGHRINDIEKKWCPFLNQIVSRRGLGDFVEKSFDLNAICGKFEVQDDWMKCKKRKLPRSEEERLKVSKRVKLY